jgi:hypothetical protein
MKSGTIWIGTFLAMMVLVMPGCGGGSATTASGPLTRQQFIAQATPICQKVGKDRERLIEELLAAGASGGSPKELEAALRQLIFPLYQDAIAEMASLNPPRGDQAAAKLIRRFQMTLKKAEADPGKLIKHNSFIEVDQVAAKYGLKGCTF